MASTGNYTTEQIAKASGLSCSCFFKRARILKLPGGLERSFRDTRRAISAPWADGPTLREMRVRFESGQSAKEIREWLATRDRPVAMTVANIYYYRLKLGYTRKRPLKKARRKQVVTPRMDPLTCALDKRDMAKLEFLRGGFTTTERARRILSILRALGERTRSIAELRSRGKSFSIRQAFPGKNLVKALRCSPKLLYRIAQQYRQTKGEFERFVRLAFEKGAQADIIDHLNDMPGIS